MSGDQLNGATEQGTVHPFAAPAIFRNRPVSSWLVIGALIVFLLLSLGLFYEAVSPGTGFWFQPWVQADSNTYWALSGVKDGMYLAPSPDGSSGLQLTSNTLGQIAQAKIFRTDFGILVSNVGVLIILLWVVGTMKEYDRGTFTLLLILNPMLISAIITLNKEIFAIAGLVFFVRYMTAKKHRGLLLILALMVSFAARWQQMATMLFLAFLESRLSPLRNKPVAGIATVLLFFTVAYTAVYHMAPVLIAGLLAQAEGGHTIVILDNIQGNFGFPLVVVPKILMNVMGKFSTPKYFFGDYWTADFSNWYDQIFTNAQELLTTVLLLGLFVAKKLRLSDPPVYLLALYLILTAVNPMVQPRYEYPAYVLLCLQASRYFRLDGRRVTATAPSQRTRLSTETAPSIS